MQSYCILISCGARLAPFDIKELRDLMAYDEMELDMLGDQRTAMFVIISDTDDTFNFVVSILYTQLFNDRASESDPAGVADPACRTDGQHRNGASGHLV